MRESRETPLCRRGAYAVFVRGGLRGVLLTQPGDRHLAALFKVTGLVAVATLGGSTSPRATRPSRSSAGSTMRRPRRSRTPLPKRSARPRRAAAASPGRPGAPRRVPAQRLRQVRVRTSRSSRRSCWHRRRRKRKTPKTPPPERRPRACAAVLRSGARRGAATSAGSSPPRRCRRRGYLPASSMEIPPPAAHWTYLLDTQGRVRGGGGGGDRGGRRRRVRRVRAVCAEASILRSRAARRWCRRRRGVVTERAGALGVAGVGRADRKHTIGIARGF